MKRAMWEMNFAAGSLTFSVEGYMRAHPAADYQLGQNAARALRAAGFSVKIFFKKRGRATWLISAA
ncbi:hypothetical protein QW131_30815 [Roseibium salinum]|nr:hypothetical protein [Roseibium salinum]